MSPFGLCGTVVFPCLESSEHTYLVLSHLATLSRFSSDIMKLAVLGLFGLSVASALASPAADTNDDKKDSDVSAQLSDIHSIRQTISKYAQALDQHRLNDLDPLFTKDGTWSSPSYGTLKVSALKELLIKLGADKPSQHLFTNDVIDLNAKAGTASCTINVLSYTYGLPSANKTLVINAYYKDTFERTRKGKFYPELEWRFKSRQFVPLVSRNRHSLFYADCGKLPVNLG